MFYHKPHAYSVHTLLYSGEYSNKWCSSFFKFSKNV